MSVLQLLHTVKSQSAPLSGFVQHQRFEIISLLSLLTPREFSVEPFISNKYI